MSRLQELREKRAKIYAEMRTLSDKINTEKRNFTAEENAKWEEINKDYNETDASVKVLERADSLKLDLESRSKELPGNEDTETKETRSRKGKREQREQRQHQGKVLDRAKALALQAWAFRGSDKALTDDHKNACKLLNVNPRSKIFSIKLDKYPMRAQSKGTTTAGGFTVPTGFIANLEKALLDYNAVRGVADVMRTDTGETLPWPTANDTGNTGELLAENTEVAYQDVTFGQTSFSAYKFSSKCIKVSHELMVDSALEMGTVFGDILGERLGRIQATYATTGTGSSQPGGVVTGSTLGKTAASATAIAADEILDLVHSVDPAYRTGPKVGFMMHDGIMLAIRKLKDANNQYLWQPSNQMGIPDRLLGYPVYVNQNMQATIATATKTILFGDFSKMKIRDVGEIRLKRLEERFAELDQLAFIAFARMDCKVLNAGTNPIKHMLQA